MILIKKRIGKRKGKKSTSIKIERQHTIEKIKSFSVSKISTYEIYDLLKNKIIPLFEDKINISNVLEFTSEIKKLVNPNILKVIENFEEKIRR